MSYTLNISGKIKDLRSPLVMGILNLTYDSFYSGSRITDNEALLQRAGTMIEEGADILDIGAMSTRPGAKEIPVDVERDRIVVGLRTLRKTFPDIPISVDTYRAEVAEAALEYGAGIINDISGYAFDPNMVDFLKSYKPVYILMHNKAKADEMTSHANYKDVVTEVFDYLSAKLHELRSWGLTDVIIDPGIGFSKGISQNFELLKQLDYFKHLNAPLLIGISRKSMIYKTLGITPEEALNGTTAVHVYALLNGANILRVHDVAEARQAITLIKNLK